MRCRLRTQSATPFLGTSVNLNVNSVRSSGESEHFVFHLGITFELNSLYDFGVRVSQSESECVKNSVFQTIIHPKILS